MKPDVLRIRAAGWLLGVSIGGYVDGLILLALWRWHLLGEAQFGSNPAARLEMHHLFHFGLFAAAAAAVALLAIGRTWFWESHSPRRLSADLLLAFGDWHLLDGVFAHRLLSIHRDFHPQANAVLWDLAFLVLLGMLPVLAGWRLDRSLPGREVTAEEASRSAQGRHPPRDPLGVTAREKFEFEKEMRQGELELRRQEVWRTRWGNPLVIAIFTAAAAALANLAVTYLTARKEARMEAVKAQNALVMAALKTDDDDGARKSAVNLKFMADIGLLQDKSVAVRANDFILSGRPPFMGSNQPSEAGGRAGAGPATTPSPPVPASGAAVHYDFKTMNGQAVDPAGWDIDVLTCAPENAPRYAVAERFAQSLAAVADRAVPKERPAGQRLGRIRFSHTKGWPPTNVVTSDSGEEALADALVSKASQETRISFQRTQNQQRPTPYYLTVFFCGP